MLISYLKALSTLWLEVQRQRRFNAQFLMPYLQHLEAQYQGTFPEAQLKKITAYYGLFIPSVLCASYKRLKGQRLHPEERKRAVLLGILTPVGDDLFDVDQLDAESIRTIAFTPDIYQATSFSGNVARHIQSYLLKTVPATEAYRQASAQVFNVQLQTLRQTKPDITDAEVETITDAKGGYSVILYHQLLNEPADATLQQALFAIGALMQLANDCFDVYKDCQDHIITLATRNNDYAALKQKYFDKVRKANQLVLALPYSMPRKRVFLITMHAIIAQGLVAIEQLQKLQQLHGQPLNCHAMPRKALITDMQKVRNILCWMYYAVTLPTLK